MSTRTTRGATKCVRHGFVQADLSALPGDIAAMHAAALARGHTRVTSWAPDAHRGVRGGVRCDRCTRGAIRGADGVLYDGSLLSQGCWTRSVPYPET